MTPREKTLTYFFKLCSDDPCDRSLCYHQVAPYYHQVASYKTWNKSSKNWTTRKRGSLVEGNSNIRFYSRLGHLYTVYPIQQDCFYLLLHGVQNPVSFEDFRRIDGIVYTTYREAYYKRGLIEDNSQSDATFSEASVPYDAKKVLDLFSAILIKTCGISKPQGL